MNLPRGHPAFPQCKKATLTQQESAGVIGFQALWQMGRGTNHVTGSALLLPHSSGTSWSSQASPRQAVGRSSAKGFSQGHWAPGFGALSSERQGGRGSCHTEKRNDRNLPTPGARRGRHTPSFCCYKSRASKQRGEERPLLVASGAWG